ncbi:S46 family peptidase [bacterium]|nr:S46 family peptidase [bacterium]
MKKLGIILILLLAVTAYADEGMWLLTQLDQLKLKEQGLEIPLEAIYSPDKVSLTDAIVWLGGCSSSFVSPDGLILTNHHCAYGALQRASKEGSDYIKNGFLARTRGEEIQAIGSTASVLQEMRDVTDDVLGTAAGITDPVERAKKIDEKIRAMTEKIENGREDILAQVIAMYKGKQYILFVYKRYRDVRIVYAPPASIGKYGGDIDNWMWPRHTGDFTFMRVYQAPDGSGATYSPDNVPVTPKNYLRVARDHLKKGDFTFILGFPGSTNRWRTSNSAGWNLKYNFPETVQNFQEIIDILDETTRDSEEGRIRVASLRSGLANTMKNYQGQIEGMTKTGFLQKKKDFEKELMDFITGDRKLKQKYGDVLDRIRDQYAVLAETKTKDDILGLFGFANGTISSLAGQIWGVAMERAKPASERNPGFNEEAIDRNVANLHYQFYNYFEPADKAMLKRVLTRASALPAGDRLEKLDALLAGASVDAFVEKAYAASKLTDVEFAKTLFKKSPKELKALNDPFINIAAAIYDEQEANGKRTEVFNATIQELRKEYLDALYAWKGAGLYPDANSTLRFTYGHVAGYTPADAVWYEPFTTLKGVVEKNTGVEPFDMPAKLGELYENKDYGTWMHPDLNDVCVGFTHRCDITGGNSGSAVMNARGELIGLAFDGNYEAMTGDWQYDYDMQRTISVNIHYVLFVAEKFGGAGFLLEEMGIN